MRAVLSIAQWSLRSTTLLPSCGVFEGTMTALQAVEECVNKGRGMIALTDLRRMMYVLLSRS
jgi:hypothetical protein